MAIRKIQVFEGQGIFDIAIQEYGSIENTFDLLAENTSLVFDSSLSSGLELKVDTDDKGVSDVKNKIRQDDFKVVNSQQVDESTVEGDYNNDLNNDFLN